MLLSLINMGIPRQKPEGLRPQRFLGPAKAFAVI